MSFKKDIHFQDDLKPTLDLRLLTNELWVMINEYIGEDFTFYKTARAEIDELGLPMGILNEQIE